jgi:hypothetical protein
LAIAIPHEAPLQGAGSSHHQNPRAAAAGAGLPWAGMRNPVGAGTTRDPIMGGVGWRGIGPFGLRGAITAFRASGQTIGSRRANRPSGRKKAAIPCRTPHGRSSLATHWRGGLRPVLPTGGPPPTHRPLTLSDCGERSPLSGRPDRRLAPGAPTGPPDGEKRQSLAALHTGAPHWRPIGAED